MEKMSQTGVYAWFLILCVHWLLLANVDICRSASIPGTADVESIAVSAHSRDKRDSRDDEEKKDINYFQVCMQRLGMFTTNLFNPPRQYQCEGTNKCIPLSMRCDGEVHCPNGSDEMGCEDQTRPGGRTICPGGYTPCREGQCVDFATPEGEGIQRLCDDEFYRECSYKYRKVVLEMCERVNASEVLRQNLSRYDCDSHFCGGWCVSDFNICDGYKNCDDGWDEDPEMCAQRPCDTVKCRKKWANTDDGTVCITSYELCNGYDECEHGEDEQEEVCRNRTCAEDQFQCGNGRCIYEWDVCNNYTDCTDGSDEEAQMCREKRENDTIEIGVDDLESEKNCPKRVAGISVYSSRLWIPELGKCMFLHDICNTRIITKDPNELEKAFGSVENWWLMCANFTCQAGNWAFKCDARMNVLDKSFDYCLSAESVCDGFTDCEDGSDEDPALCRPERPCIPGYFRCGDGTCISDLLVCDGTHHCRNGADEDPELCNADRECADATTRKCGESGQCVYEAHFCDREITCWNGYDELAEVCGYFGHEERTCPSGFHPCYGIYGHPTCVHDHYYCTEDYASYCIKENRTHECEARVSQCPPGLLPCGDGQCVREDQICSGSYYQCYNGAMSSDEYCAERVCREDEFSCGLGQCIPTSLVCDGVTTDCIRTGADESPQTCDQNYSATTTATAAVGSSEVSPDSSNQQQQQRLPVGPSGASSYSTTAAAAASCQDKTDVCARLLPLGICHRHVAFAADLCAHSCSLCGATYHYSGAAGAQKYYNVNINFL